MAHYMRLGLTPPVTRAQIAEAYRSAAMKHHPDRGGCGPTFAAITDSYNALINHATHPYGFRPASLRSYVDRDQTNGFSMGPFGGVVGALIFPTLIGVALGVHLIRFGREREGLRAGGTSRFVPSSEQTRSS